MASHRQKVFGRIVVLGMAVVILPVYFLIHRGRTPQLPGRAAAAEVGASGLFVPTDRPASISFLGMTAADAGRLPPKRLTLSRAFAHLSFSDPVMLLPVPRSNRLCVIGREGVVETFENDPNVSKKDLVLDLRAHCQGWGDSGLLGIAFHPEFGQAGSPNRGYFYVWFNYVDTPGAGPRTPRHEQLSRDRLVRYTMVDGSNEADPASAQTLIDQHDRDLWHNGGGIFFGADGLLYLSVGDEGRDRDSLGNAQRIDTGLFSGLIRIDVDQDARRSHPIPKHPTFGFTAHYMIPNDNPWVGKPGVLEEFYCLGLRSPHRVTRDPVSNTIWCGDVGQGGWEEIDLLEKGCNYQWSYREGNHPGPKPRPAAGEILGIERGPLYEYHHDLQNNAVIGGYVYRGRQMPEFQGQYIFGDNVSGRIWAMSAWQKGKPIVTEIAQMPGRAYSGLSSFGCDADGELYMCQLGAEDGAIYHLTTDRSSDGPPLPDLISKTHAFEDLASLKPSSSLIPYTINVPFWSDGAVKRRWISVPGRAPFSGAGERIDFSENGSFKFPAGTVFVKHFELPLDESNPKRVRRVETRLIMCGQQGDIYGATYRWRPDGSDADRLDESATEDIAVVSNSDVGLLTGNNLGDGDRPAEFQRADHGMDISSWARGIASTSDHLSFASTPTSDDFDVRVRLQSFESPANGALAGLMFRQGSPGSPFFCVLLHPGSPGSVDKQGLVVLVRKAANQQAEQLYVGERPAFPNAWLRIQRCAGTTFSAFSSADGFNWVALGAGAKLFLPSEGQVGVVASSDASAAQVTTAFRDLTPLRRQTWYYPSPTDCISCHAQNAGYILGVTARQLNMDIADPATGRGGNQLGAWANIGMFSGPLTAKQAVASPRLARISDQSAPLVERARSYLDANCGYCHRPGGAGGFFDARFVTSLENQNFTTDQLRNPLGVDGARVIAPGDLTRSLLFRRIHTVYPAEKMPPIGRNSIDDAGSDLLRQWILEMQDAKN